MKEKAISGQEGDKRSIGPEQIQREGLTEMDREQKNSRLPACAQHRKCGAVNQKRLTCWKIKKAM